MFNLSNITDDPWFLESPDTNFMMSSHSCKNAQDQVQAAIEQLFSRFPSPFSLESPETAAAMKHRCSMWQSISANELTYWQKHPDTLKAVIQAFESTAPLLIRNSEKRDLGSETVDLLNRAHQIVQELQEELFLTEDPKVAQMYKTLSLMKGVLKLVTNEPQPSPVPENDFFLADTIFAGATTVELYGDAKSIVWNKRTLYCIRDIIAETPLQKVTRAWVDWRASESTEPSRVCVFLRPNDWKPAMAKFMLKTKKLKLNQERGGWRTFSVSPYIKEDDKDDSGPQPALSALSRLDLLEKKMAAVEAKLAM